MTQHERRVLNNSTGLNSKYHRIGSDVLSGKLLQSHDWCVILAGEPSAALISVAILDNRIYNAFLLDDVFLL
jgi:hypothetical protein